MPIKFHWHVEKDSQELDLGPGFISISPECNIIETNHVR